MNKIKVMIVPYLPVIYRFVRGAVATAIATTFSLSFILNLDWSKPKNAIAVLIATFLSAFLMALGKAIRDNYGGAKYNRVDTLDRVLPV